MIWALIGGAALAGALAGFVAGAVRHQWLEDTLTWLLIKLMPSDGDHAPGADRRRYDRLPEDDEPVTLYAREEDDPFLPPEPELPPYATAWMPVEPAETPDKPPWMITTAAMDALPAQPTFTPRSDAAEQDRRWYQMSHQGMTDDDIRADMRRVYAGRHAVSAPAYGPLAIGPGPAGRQDAGLPVMLP